MSYPTLNSENAQLLSAIINETPYTKDTNSRNAKILKSILDETEYNDEPQSEIEELLLDLKEKIEDESDIVALTVTENGTYSEAGKAYSPVTVALPLDSKSITSNGTYSASDDNLQGYSSVTVDVDGYTTANASGSLISVTDSVALPLSKCEVEIEATQDLNGYDKPWAGGSNTNKFPNALSGTQTVNGITVVSDGKGTYTISGEAEANTSITFDLVDDFTFPISVAQGGTGVIYLGNNFVSTPSQVYFYYNDTQVNYFTFTEENRVSNYYSNNLGGKTINKINFYIPNGASISGKCSLMCVNNSSTTETFSPYFNICPITGYNTVNLYLADNTTETTPRATVSLGSTYYGGTLDILRGELSVTYGYIASYNGETLTGEWLSDRDEYASGTTPTVGAEVAYELSTPTTLTLDEDFIEGLSGVMNVWANCGDSDITYFKEV